MLDYRIVLLDITALPWVAWMTAASAPLSAIGLALFAWVIQGRLAEGLKKEMMAHINTLRQHSVEIDMRLEQKIDLLTTQLRDNVQAVGADVKRLQSDIPTGIEASASAVKSELRDVKKDIRDILVTMTTGQAMVQVGFQNMEKMVTLQIRAEVAEQIARAASRG